MADQRTYNARVTTEALEKKFRDTFPSQAGAALGNDLFASGVIVPTVDFTAAAQGSELEPNLQRAWDFATANNIINGASTTTLTSTPGFYKVDLIASTNDFARASVVIIADIIIDDGATDVAVWRWSTVGQAGTAPQAIQEGQFIVYLRSGDSLKGRTAAASETMNVWYRQIADVSGNLVNPLGFTSS